MNKIPTKFDRLEPRYQYLPDLLTLGGLQVDQGILSDADTIKELWTILEPLNQAERAIVLESARKAYRGHGKLFENAVGFDRAQRELIEGTRSCVDFSVGQVDSSMKYLDQYLNESEGKPTFSHYNSGVVTRATDPVYRPNVDELGKFSGITEVVGGTQAQYDEMLIQAGEGTTPKHLKKMLSGGKVSGLMVDEPELIMRHLQRSANRFSTGTIGNTALDMAVHNLQTMGLNLFSTETQYSIENLYGGFSTFYAQIHKKAPDSATYNSMKGLIDSMLSGEIDERVFNEEVYKLFKLECNFEVAETAFNHKTKAFGVEERREEWVRTVQEYILSTKIFLFKMKHINHKNMQALTGRESIFTTLLRPDLLLKNRSVLPIRSPRTATDKIAANISGSLGINDRNFGDYDISGQKGVLR
ncbi:hypothetical protein JW758_03550 [Candidatus Peregrinibacteria bacterium]|nr:hypothetical protein [Candidatus Peregrinibacteria bacterium]